MKLSSLILVIMLASIVTALFASDIVLKNKYDKIDKSDLYWNYNKVFDKPFKYLKIDGGNVTNIKFERSNKYSVRVLDTWEAYQQDNSILKMYVKDDTLHFNFLYQIKNPDDKYR